MEKDVDSSDWSSDEIRIDFLALRKAYQNVFELPSHVYESSLIRALVLLAGKYFTPILHICFSLLIIFPFSETTEMELKVELKDRLNNPEDMEKYVISFLIIFEMPTLGNPEYLHEALPLLCKAMSHLPVSALARICRVWARYCRNSFRNILELLHQLITTRTVESCGGKRYPLHDNIDIISATKVMKVSSP